VTLEHNQNHGRVAVVEDHVLQRKRIEDLLSKQGFEVVHSGETLPEFVEWLQGNTRPDLLVLDLMVDRQPSVDPSVVANLVRAGQRIVVLSALGSPLLVQQVVRAGVAGVVGKRDSEEDLIEAICAVVQNGEWMTSELASVIAGDANRPKLSFQEERALVLYGSGLAIDAVARAIGVQPETAKGYLSRVKAKYATLGRPAQTKLELYQQAVLDGYLSFPAVRDRSN
jgi:DNA-binding NarL/FixJ family response regulator